MRSHRFNPEAVVTVRKKVKGVFSNLRKEGIVARMNFMCCMTCAQAALPNDKPNAYYHRQDHDRLLESGKLHIRYSTPDGKGCKELGEKVASALRAKGLTVDWNGDPSQTITVQA